jgi:hypothetical protein
MLVDYKCKKQLSRNVFQFIYTHILLSYYDVMVTYVRFCMTKNEPKSLERLNSLSLRQ